MIGALENIKNNIFLGSLCVISGFSYYQFTQLEKIKVENKASIEIAAKAISQRDEAFAASIENTNTINALILERKNIDDAFLQLQKEQKAIKTMIGKLDIIIKDGDNDPSNKDAVAPVIKNVINAIQLSRKERRVEPQ